MKGLLWNLMLALAWAAVNGNFNGSTLLVGFTLGLFVLLLTRRAIGISEYGHKLVQVVGLVLFFIWELILANLRVAYDVLTPSYNMRPGVVAIPLDANTEAQITLLANLITLTPGTLSLDVSTDQRVLYIHALYIDDELDVFRQKIKDGFERRIMEVLS